MSSKTSLSIFLTLNILFFTHTAATCSKCIPTVPTVPTIPTTGTCPIDALKLGVCANVLNLVDLTLGDPPVTPCCSLVDGLVDLEAAVCLCTALKASVLGLNLNLPINLTLLLNVCSVTPPKGFQCA